MYIKIQNKSKLKKKSKQSHNSEENKNQETSEITEQNKDSEDAGNKNENQTDAKGQNESQAQLQIKENKGTSEKTENLQIKGVHEQSRNQEQKGTTQEGSKSEKGKRVKKKYYSLNNLHRKLRINRIYSSVNLYVTCKSEKSTKNKIKYKSVDWKDRVINCAQKIVKEIEEKKYKGIGFSILSKDKPVPFPLRLNLVCDILNDDSFNEIVLDPGTYPLKKILIIVDSDEAEEEVNKKFKQDKQKWAKWRKLSFVIDALNPKLKRKRVVARHFIHNSLYPKYLKEFFPECENSLLERERNKLIAKHGSLGAHILDLIESLNKVSDIFCRIRDEDKNRRFLNFECAWAGCFYQDLPFDLKTFNERIPEFDLKLLYLWQLIPDEEVRKEGFHMDDLIKMQMERLSANIEDEDESNERNLYIDDFRKYLDIDDVEKICKNLRKIIAKTKELSDVDGIPIHLLERFWGKDIFDRIVTKKASAEKPQADDNVGEKVQANGSPAQHLNPSEKAVEESSLDEPVTGETNLGEIAAEKSDSEAYSSDELASKESVAAEMEPKEDVAGESKPNLHTTQESQSEENEAAKEERKDLGNENIKSENDSSNDSETNKPVAETKKDNPDSPYNLACEWLAKLYGCPIQAIKDRVYRN